MRLEFFQMIDEVTTLDVSAGRLVATSRVPEESPVFEGHFPGHPLMPGVLLIEAMAQASGYLIMARNDFSRLPLLAQVKSAKLRQFIEPNERLTIEASVEHDGSGFAVMNARIQRDSEAAADATLNMKTMPFPSETLRRYIMESAETAGLLALEA